MNISLTEKLDLAFLFSVDNGDFDRGEADELDCDRSSLVVIFNLCSCV